MTLPAHIKNQLSPESLRFLEEFRAQNGRAPRICHLGNIASNAYHNAKLLALVGIDSDVVALNDYFVMSTPEWEEADMKSVPPDIFYPEWWNVDLAGYKRPKWFVQGLAEHCLEYLVAKLEHQDIKADGCWNILSRENKTAPPSQVPDVMKGVRRAGRVLRRMLARARRSLQKQPVYAPPDPEYWARISSTYQKQFPGRPDAINVKDVEWATGSLDLWNVALRHYDIVIGYSTYPLFPLLCGIPYLALEHGTLRDIPFQPDAQGRTTALSYSQAEHVFVTNFDCLPKAEILAPGKYTFLNHPYHLDHALPVGGVGELRQVLRTELDADFLVFFPARHDWVKDTGFADKGNDVFIRAFADARAAGHRVGMILCEWGRNIAESKALLHELGVASHVRWMLPVGAVGFNRHCQACDLVADQFTLGAFGGVLFKAFCNSRPVITYLDEKQLLPVYPQLPPVLNGRTREDLVRLLSEAIANPANLKALGLQGRQWVERCHNGMETVDRQLRVFSDVLRRREGRA